jgi:DNA-binding IclR family transcriptional regulator
LRQAADGGLTAAPAAAYFGTAKTDRQVMSKIVERTLDLLELFAEEKRPLSLSDIARLLKIPVSSCHDVLQAMQARGYLYELAPRAGYYPTLRLQRLGKEIGDHDPVVARADVVLRSLRDTLDESVLLAKVSNLQATYLLVFEPTHPLRFLMKAGDPVRSLHATSGGKALLSSLHEKELTAFLRTASLTPMTDRTITSRTALREDIELGRKRGWFVNIGESQEGVTTISAPFRWNNAVYIVTVAGPSPRLDQRLEQATALITNVCQLLEMRASGTPAGWPAARTA